jgi:aminoglycoside 6'-N-acetyltransferase I
MKKENIDKYFFSDEEFFEGVDDSILESTTPKIESSLDIEDFEDIHEDGFYLVEPEDTQFIEEAALLLQIVYPHLLYTQAEAENEIMRVFQQGSIFIIRVIDEQIVGMIGARPTHGSTGYELFPHVVSPDKQNQGMGSVLLQMLETELSKRQATVLFLATEDEMGETSISDIDLFEDPFPSLQELKSDSTHPYVYYRKRGFKVFGVIPDAFGIGKPDIIMAKRIKPE